jgi:MFS transporter, ACS family, DAL5 transporter family protein
MAHNSTEDHTGKMLETQEPPVHQVEAVDHDQLYTIDPEEERKVVRKLDCVIMPLMAVVYFFQCESKFRQYPLQVSNIPR